MKKRGRKKKQVKAESESLQTQVNDQDGPVLDLEKSIIKNSLNKVKRMGISPMN